MTSLIQRHSLIVQTVELLRKGIASGEWGDRFPSERNLSTRIGVSRPTLRSALRILEREGVIRNAHGKRRQAVPALLTEPRKELPRVVGFIAADPHHAATTFQVLRVGELRNYLGQMGYELEIHSHSRLFSQNPREALEELVCEHPARCWILNSARRATQEWFASRGLPTVLFGTCYPGIDMPAMSVHHTAICRHAVATFTRLGHSRIALVIRESGYAGDLESEDSFRDAITLAGLDPRLCPILRHGLTVREICAVLAECFGSASRPTAILVAVPGHAITVASYLISEGYCIPEDVSVICRDEDDYLDHFVPRVARYRYHTGNYLRRLCRLVGRIVNDGNLPIRPIKIFPNLDKARTLGPPPAGSGN